MFLGVLLPCMPEDVNIKRIRDENPTGWLELIQREDMEYIIDALLETPPDHTGSLTQFAERSGVDVDTVRDNFEFLEDLDVLYIEGDEYTINGDSTVMAELNQLNSAISSEFPVSDD